MGTEGRCDAANVTELSMYDTIVSAILDHKLLPGTKLVEDKLAEVFGVSRTRIRPVLVRLANEHIVTLVPNRGAFIAQPTPEEAHEVFEARCLIEPTLVERFLMRATESDIEALRDLIDLEEQARQQGDQQRAIRLSGEFHLRIAEASGHLTLGRILRELVSRTSLILMTYGPTERMLHHPTPTSTCGCDEHRALMQAIRLRATAEAKRLMREHLERLEFQLVFPTDTDKSLDLVSILAPEPSRN